MILIESRIPLFGIMLQGTLVLFQLTIWKAMADAGLGRQERLMR